MYGDSDVIGVGAGSGAGGLAATSVMGFDLSMMLLVSFALVIMGVVGVRIAARRRG